MKVGGQIDCSLDVMNVVDIVKELHHCALTANRTKVLDASSLRQKSFNISHTFRAVNLLTKRERM